ncbi:putative Oleoyl-acyl carrier protein thioesterase 1, chloroplastic [Nannochloris sp. 'desiccata']|nr:putative Oleoyl-acyl carrier protein thioesterase 1, chloroplastic [Chlorella desiccata (nom. nud.)]
MAQTILGTHWAIKSPCLGRNNTLNDVEARLVRCNIPFLRDRASLSNFICASTSTANSAETSKAPSTARPPCYKEVWTPPEPSMLIKDKRVFREEHRIRGYEVGPDQHASIVTIANLLQEVASNHAVAMWGRSIEGFAADPELAELGLIFVMTRMQVQMDHYPRWGDMVQIETWFQEAGKIGAQRDWVITDRISGRHLGRATSTWVMININTRRLSKMPESMRQRCGWYQMDPPANAIPSNFTRLKIPELDLSASKNTPTSITSNGAEHSTKIGVENTLEGGQQRFVARRGDVDMNGHINNAIYFAWGIETVPEEVYQNCHLYQMEVDFKAECLCGDVIEAHGQAVSTPEELASNGAGPSALTFAHSLQRYAKENNKCTELVRARTVWRAGEPSSS